MGSSFVPSRTRIGTMNRAAARRSAVTERSGDTALPRHVDRRPERQFLLS